MATLLKKKQMPYISEVVGSILARNVSIANGSLAELPGAKQTQICTERVKTLNILDFLNLKKMWAISVKTYLCSVMAFEELSSSRNKNFQRPIKIVGSNETTEFSGNYKPAEKNGGTQIAVPIYSSALDFDFTNISGLILTLQRKSLWPIT